MGRKFKAKEIESFKAVDLSVDGRAVGRDDEMVIFVKGMVPGDIGKVRVTNKRRRYFEGQLEELHEASPARTEPKCRHFGECGGCKWQHLSYSKQLEFKQNQVDKAFEKIAHLSDYKPLPILGSENEYEYRNKLEFSFSNKRWILKSELESAEEITERNALGYHVPRLFDKVIDIQECHLMDHFANEIRNELRRYALEEGIKFYDIRENHGELRNVFIRKSSIGEWMINLVFGTDDQDLIQKVMNHLQNKFHEVTSLNYTINTKKNDSIADLETHNFSGKDHITESMDDLKFKIRPKSFYQTNSAQAQRLYAIAVEFADLQPNETLYDLYTGTGTIALYCARNVKNVVGIEYVDQAIKDAKENAAENGIENAAFFHGDMQKVLNEEFISTNGKPDVIITDPPRAGMHPDVIKTIVNTDVDRIVYVSCNPATQARDVELMKDKYRVEKGRAVDMFPHTSHIENVVLLKKK